MIFLAALMLLADKPASAPLAPSGKWQVDYADNSCMLARPFGAEQHKTLLGITAIPFNAEYTIALEEQGELVRRRNDSVSVILDDGQPQKATYWTMSAPQPGRRRLTLSVPRTSFDNPNESAAIKIVEPGGTAVVFHADQLKLGLEALKVCLDDLARSWGMEKELLQPSAKLAVARDSAAWITVADYPAESIRAHEEGKVVAVWRIGVDGRVDGCRIVVSSGYARLDAASCTAITTRGRYKPAVDDAGNPVASYASRSVTWALPEF